jgi:hypothetical protein
LGADGALAEDVDCTIVADGEALPHSFLKSNDRPSRIRKKQTESSALATAKSVRGMGTISVVRDRSAIKLDGFSMVEDSFNADRCISSSYDA